MTKIVVWETSGKHLEAFGVRLEASGRHLEASGGIWEASGSLGAMPAHKSAAILEQNAKVPLECMVSGTIPENT